MKLKRFCVSILVTLLSLSVLSCGTTNATDQSTVQADPTTVADSQTVAHETTAAQTAAQTDAATDTTAEIGGKLVIWEHTAQFEPPLKAVIEGFNKQYPNVEVEYQIKTSDQYYNLLQTAMQAGETPDLFWTNGNATTNYKTYASEGYLMDITDKVDFSLYDDTKAMTIVDQNGKYYATPTAELGGRAVFYNKDIFNELNLEIPKTFSEFETVLETIHAAGIIPISFAASDPWTCLFHFEPVLAGMSLDWLQEYDTTKDVKVNDPRVVAAYNKMLEWADKGYYGSGYTGVDGSGALLAFSKGTAAMSIDGTWNIQTIKDNNPDLNFGAFQIPTEAGEIPFVSTSSCGFSISNNTKNPDAALAFANYFASLEGQTLWVNTNNAIPAVKSIQAPDPVIGDITNFDLIATSYYDILGWEAGTGESPTKVWEEDQTKVFSGGIDPQTFTDELEALTK